MMIYVSLQFAAAETDVPGLFIPNKARYSTYSPYLIIGYIEGMIAETNAGLENSQVNVKIEVLCVEELEVDEAVTSSELLDWFKTAKGSVEATLNSADFAFLLVENMESGFCGKAYFLTNVWPFGMQNA